MSITIEQLDKSAFTEKITIILGKDLILKFFPKKSLLNSEKSLQDLIKTPNLLTIDTVEEIKDLVNISQEISDNLGKMISDRELYTSFRKKYTTDKEFIEKEAKKGFAEGKEKIIRLGEIVKEKENKIGIFLAKDYNLHFCENCDGYFSDSPEFLPPNCSFCGKELEWGKSMALVRFLRPDVKRYLNGDWLEDYIAKLLKASTWKTWCGGQIMGSSGIPHQIDILAINIGQGLALIGECKTGLLNKSSQVFNFSTKYFDIKINYGFIFSLEELTDPNAKAFMRKTPGLCCLDGIKGLTDEQITTKFATFL